MPRKNYKAIVKAERPDAMAERQKTNGRRTYWLIRFGRSFMWFSSGETEALAWKAAAEKLAKRAALPPETP